MLAPFAPLVALAATLGPAAPGAAALPEPAARVVGHDRVVDAIVRDDGSTVSLGADGLVVEWDADAPQRWTRIPGAVRLVDRGRDALDVVGDTARVTLDRDFAPVDSAEHDAVVVCAGAAPGWVRGDAGWFVIDPTGTSAPIDAPVDDGRCSTTADGVWLAGFDGADAIAIGHTDAGPVITRVPWDSGRQPTVAEHDGRSVLVAGDRRIVDARTGAETTDVVAPDLGWCADRSASPTAPCREPRAAFEAPTPGAYVPIDVVWDGRSVSIVEAHGWLRVTATPGRDGLASEHFARPGATVIDADATHGVALVCERSTPGSRWTLQALASGEAVALVDVDGACPVAPAGAGLSAPGVTDTAIVEISSARTIRATTATELGLSGRTLVGATVPLGRDGRRLVLTRRFDAACPVARFELVRTAVGDPAEPVADLGCGTDASLGDLTSDGGSTGIAVDLRDGDRRVAIGVRFDGQVATIVPLHDTPGRVGRLTTSASGTSVDDPVAGTRLVRSADTAAEDAAPLLVVDRAGLRVWLDAWGLALQSEHGTVRVQRSGEDVVIDDGRAMLTTPGWAARVVGPQAPDGDEASALGLAWFGPPRGLSTDAPERRVFDRFRTWRETSRERRQTAPAGDAPAND